ncbi:lipoprotein releasing system, transmembrane protein LolC [Aggregatibacter actinomycetemcomitans serotype e str. SC1083]|uniref:Lipoprotein releasing system, transmembrane protein LolC n=1 Tax=Aggregatibacter actinomycetemcomitans serotype e str. SC1083 TaxID=907488 RepID=G4A6A7_AGGAC|nr:lipoprotein-releasing ABC transporter permease subunit [Aggregatibacter actinomycetemcomitans]EGY34872.1 lipoprotein releasing system, transmembrane protein LolC [Aggregatibacter actinomycetemcomitans serotype e str. SC1083]KYK74646.1 lipoprotein-releasing system transmembrane protein LolC [Aggregatibacter actinomycetemcomitans serotype e str. SA3096]KYK81475.1 lipoprotein-releasing system transmembrane protein LolC [Aggregatibacter actinomycetemcomitans serotype e str. SC936]KYK93117.1 lipo
MTLSTPLFIALRYWRAKSADRFGRLVTNLAGFGIVLGVMALIIVLSVMNGLEGYQKQQVLSTIPHAIVSLNGNAKIDEAQLPIPNFVQKAVPINMTNVIFQTAGGVSAGQVIGIRQFSDDPILFDFPEQEFDKMLPAGEFKIIIGDQLAQKLNLHVGDKVRLMITENSQYTPFGRVSLQRLFTVSEIYFDSGEVSGYEAFANLTDIGRLMRIQPGEAQGFRLFLADPFQITALPTAFPADYQISDWRTQKGEFFQAVRMEKNMMGLLVSLIIVVAISNIITSLSLMVVDKQGEIAILQTQGLTKGQVRSIFIYQGLLVGLMGTLPGSILGVLVTLNLDGIVNLFGAQTMYLPTALEPWQILTIIAFSLLLSLLSTIYPAYRAAKVEPAEALRYE